MVRMVAEHKESATACNNTRLFRCNLMQDLGLCLKHVFSGQHIEHLTVFCNTGSAIDQSITDFSYALEVLPPPGLAALQLLYFIGKKFNDSLKKDAFLFVGNTEQIMNYKEMGYTFDDLFFYKKV